MSVNNVSVVLVHGAWADGSSWSKVIGPLRGEGARVVAAPLPLTSLADDVAALDRTLERIDGPVVLVGHAYAGAVIAGPATRKSGRWSTSRHSPPTKGKRSPRCSIAPSRIRRRPSSPPTVMAGSGFPTTPLPRLSLNMLPPRSSQCWLQFSGRSLLPASASRWAGRFGRIVRAGSSWPSRIA